MYLFPGRWIDALDWRKNIMSSIRTLRWLVQERRTRSCNRSQRWNHWSVSHDLACLATTVHTYHIPLTETKLQAFPWWPDLHGWWRTNPAFNTAFSTADPGQDFASAALQHFQVSSCQDLGLPCVPSDDDNADGSDIEDGEIADVGFIRKNSWAI